MTKLPCFVPVFALLALAACAPGSPERMIQTVSQICGTEEAELDIKSRAQARSDSRRQSFQGQTKAGCEGPNLSVRGESQVRTASRPSTFRRRGEVRTSARESITVQSDQCLIPVFLCGFRFKSTTSIDISTPNRGRRY